MKQIRNKLLAYLLVMLLTAACSGDYFCITNDPAQDLSTTSTIINTTNSIINSINVVTGPTVTYNSSSDNDILIKVSGSLNLCANDQNKPPTNCNCPAVVPNCKPTLANCQCTAAPVNCELGTSYPIPANNSSWTIVQTNAIEGETIQMTIPQANYGGPTSSNCPLTGSACTSRTTCGAPPSTDHYIGAYNPCSVTGQCDTARPCPNLTCNNIPPLLPPTPNPNGQPQPIPPATQYQGDCSGFTGGNRWTTDNYTNMPYYDINGKYPLNLCPVNNLNSTNDVMSCWNVGAMGLMFQVTNPSGPNNIYNWTTDWNQSQAFVYGGVNIPYPECPNPPCPSCSVPTIASSVGNYKTQACFMPSPYETPAPNSPPYSGVSDPNRVTTQTIVINDPTQSTVSLRVFDIFYTDNLGGYTVYVLSTCNVSNGQPLNSTGIGQLQAQISAPDGKSPPTPVILSSPIAQCSAAGASFADYCSDSDITSGNAVYYYINNSYPSGKLQFMINSSGLTNTDVSGTLNITTYSQGQIGAFSSMIQGAICIIQNVLYGNNGSNGQNCNCPQSTQVTGVIENIWNGIVGNGNYIDYLRVLLILYVLFYGILFLLGTVQISQIDLVVRIAKIGIIVALTSDESWSFFSNNLFNLFMNGSSELINLFTEGSGFSGKSDISSCSNAFSFVDDVFQVLFFDYRTWLRVLALLLASPLGFVYVLLILWGALNYFLAIIEAVISYIMSILSVSILLVLGPIFIPFILFAITRELFNRWIQFLFSFALKPVILLIGLNILSTMLLIVVLKLFSFPVCFGCAVPVFLDGLDDIVGAINSVISIGDFFFCVPWYKPWGFTNIGDGTSFSSATGLSVSGILLFVMLTTFMRKLPKFTDDMVSRLAGTRSIALKVGGGGNVAETMMNAIGDKALGIVGMDSTSRQRRKGQNTKAGPTNPKDKVGVKVRERK